jgi:formylglycine-generating enzyme required for sulfatase activity
MDGRRSLSGVGIALAVVASCRAAPPVASPSPASAIDDGAGRAEIAEVTAATVASVAAEGVPATGDEHEPLACPKGMVLVEGEYCPGVEQTCLEWLEPPGDPYEHFRCKRYRSPAVCRGGRVHKRFCIDETERTEEGSDLPKNHMSWTSATALCERDGARLCKTSEWQFACEGEEMRPYPYGWERDSSVCNVDVMHGLGKVGRLVDHRTPASAHPACVSPFGVHDMAGNVDEWATVDGAPRGKREVMKGSWWLPGRHACRSFQGGHGPLYGGTESGARCCKDAPG